MHRVARVNKTIQIKIAGRVLINNEIDGQRDKIVHRWGNMNTKNSTVWAEVPLILLFHDNGKLIKTTNNNNFWESCERTYTVMRRWGENEKQFSSQYFSLTRCRPCTQRTWLMGSHIFANFGFTHSLTRWTTALPLHPTAWNVF